MSRWSRAVGRTKALIGGRAIVFMYHRVAEPSIDPWQLAVSPARFETQVAMIARKRRVVPLAEISTRVRTGKSVRGLAAITFDDGYADNALIAHPVLERLKLPATYFVTTSILDGKSRFWWDELEDVLLRRDALPSAFAPVDGSPELAFDLGEDAVLDEPRRLAIAGWNASKPHPNRRTDVFHRVWSTLSAFSPRKRRGVLDALTEWAGPSDAPPIPTFDRSMLRELAKSDYADIGAHGVTHLALEPADPVTRGYEIGTSKSTLEEILSKRVDGFAYPNGSYDTPTTHAVASAGYRYAVTTSGIAIAGDDSPYELGRLHVGDWDVDRLARAIGGAMERSAG